MRIYMKWSTSIVLVLVLWGGCSNQIELQSERTTVAARDSFHVQLISKTINQALQTPLDESSEGPWQGAFWAMELSGYTSALTDSAIFFAMQQFTEHSPGFQRSLLEVVYTLYPKVYSEEIHELLPVLNSEKLFAMAINYLLIADPNLHADQLLLDLDRLYPDWSLNPILWSLVNTLEDTLSYPPITDLLRAEFIPELPVLFSLQPDNRDFSGLLIIRNEQGEFLKSPDGSFINFRQLGRAVTNMPWYVTNGNTPPGIYSVQGLDVSDNVFIGPTPTIQTRMPFETDLASFMHDPEMKQDWDYQHYTNLLPSSWQDYFPIWGSFFAGQAGRSEIIAHGSTINPEYYLNLPCYPLTPSLGCLTSYEVWSQVDGSIVSSDQQLLVNQINEMGMKRALLIVVPLPDMDHNLGVKDLETFFRD